VRPSETAAMSTGAAGMMEALREEAARPRTGPAVVGAEAARRTPVGVEVVRRIPEEVEAPQWVPEDQWPTVAGGPLVLPPGALRTVVAGVAGLLPPARRSRSPYLQQPGRSNPDIHRKPGGLPARISGKST
jgi:hypothetical protein